MNIGSRYGEKSMPVYKYRQSQGYQRLLEHYKDLIKQGWIFETNCTPNYRELGLSSATQRVKELREKGLEACAKRPTFSSDGRVMIGGKVIFVRRTDGCKLPKIL